MTSDALFQRYYRDVSPEAARSLQAFRAGHPTQCIVHGGARWEYVCTGTGDEALLLLHGMAGAFDIWWQLIPALGGRIKIVSLTYPAVPTLEGLRSGVNAVLEVAGIERFNLLGTSLGGYLAQYIVARQPERVLRAVFANTYPPNQILTRRTRGAGLLIRLAPEALIRFAMRLSTRLSLYPASGYSELLRAYLDEGADRSMDKARFLARYRAAVEWFDPPATQTMGIRLLILQSANDPLISSKLRALLRLTYPSAQVHSFGAVGHFPYLNEPQLYAQTLTRFLRQPIPGG